ncbi:MAG: hypothetical protein JSS82_03600 [Bacteroidetes bacterium]|nr:hypothetical protein [Bacteroidota bacterium]
METTREKGDIVLELSDDLFSCPPDYSIAHCISADAVMGRGIAVDVCKKFPKNRSALKRIGVPLQVHSVATVDIGTEDHRRFLFNMVTKPRYFSKPEMTDIEKTLDALVIACQENNVEYLAIPRIGCGLDRLFWPAVLRTIKERFSGTGIVVVVYHPPQFL